MFLLVQSQYKVPNAQILQSFQHINYFARAPFHKILPTAQLIVKKLKVSRFQFGKSIYLFSGHNLTVSSLEVWKDSTDYVEGSAILQNKDRMCKYNSRSFYLSNFYRGSINLQFIDRMVFKSIPTYVTDFPFLVVIM